MATYDVLNMIVRNGSNLVISRPLTHDALRNLAQLASESGAHLTITAELTNDILEELSGKYRSSISFIEGLGRFEKPN